MSRAPITQKLARFISDFQPADLPSDVVRYTEVLAYDGIGTLAAATHPKITSSARIGDFSESQGGPKQATLIGRDTKVGVVNAVLANGTLGYACDMEPHHPEAILHPISIMVPTALALCEAFGGRGPDFIAAVALGCEVTYRVSMAMDPKQLYGLGFHPSAVCGVFGAAAASAHLLGLDTEQTVRTLGLAALQASGLMAWQDDPNEDARPFQMGMAARNGVTAAMLAQKEFGGPDRIFDAGHNVLNAFSRAPSSEPLLDGLGEKWDGVMGLAIKPYSCVSFLHPALDALDALIRKNDLTSPEVAGVQLRFADSGSHCVDDNPLKSHCAQYVLPVWVARGGLRFVDLFEDRRKTDPEVARLASVTRVVRDHGELERLFPDFYAGEVTLTLRDGRQLTERSDIARGYPASPLSEAEIRTKFDELVGTVATAERRASLGDAAATVFEADGVQRLAELLAHRPIADAWTDDGETRAETEFETRKA
ncbi:MAG: MmgE/PrpD family protein [Alphaproteobacteria bacterium]|nr:MmgE/PrpD family protein [Alphaproteobacteria bacterium]